MGAAGLGVALPTLTLEELAFRLILAAVLSGAIGFEREVRDQEAGLRTHVLVGVGSALFTLVSAYGFEDFLGGNETIRADPARIAAQIVAGVGFLGAGAIFRQGAFVRGLTTAATLWSVAAIGLAAGAGFYSASIITSLLVLVSLWPLKMLVRSLRRQDREATTITALLPKRTRIDELLSALRTLGIDANSISFRETGHGMPELLLVVTVPARRVGLIHTVKPLLVYAGAQSIAIDGSPVGAAPSG